MLVRLEPVPGEPALLVEGSILAVADLHIGIEAELSTAGIYFPSQTMKMAARLVQLVEETGAKSIVLLGDVKHYVPATAALERRDLPLFFEAITGSIETIHVAVGNHDALIRPYVPESVRFHCPGGFVIGDTGFTHGHAWPPPSVLKCHTLVMGHNHPAVAMTDNLGGRSFRPCWVRFKFKRKVKGHDIMPKEGVMVPSFNELCGGAAVNDISTRMLGPLVGEDVADMAGADVHLLDGTYLGHLRDLGVDLGLRSRDFRQ